MSAEEYIPPEAFSEGGRSKPNQIRSQSRGTNWLQHDRAVMDYMERCKTTKEKVETKEDGAWDVCHPRCIGIYSQYGRDR